jgi:hypothetical protein
MGNWDSGQVSTLNASQGGSLICDALVAGQLYGLFLYNTANYDTQFYVQVQVTAQGTTQPDPLLVLLPGTTGQQGLAQVVLISGDDGPTVTVSLSDPPGTAQLTCLIGSVSLPVYPGGLTQAQLSNNGNEQPFGQAYRYYAVPPSAPQTLTITSPDNQFICVQFQQNFATFYVVNPVPHATDAVVNVTAYGSVSSSDYTIVMGTQGSSAVTANMTGDGTEYVWMSPDSVQDSDNVTIELAPATQDVQNLILGEGIRSA